MQRLQIPAAVLQESGTIVLNEPAHADRTCIEAQLLGGTYGKPFVIDDGRTRRLYFGLAYVQSEMSIGQPYELNFAYTRKMMAVLLFQPRPRHVVIVGLGGGSLTRFCHRRLPRARITTVEIDPDVIAFGDLFHLPQEDARHELVHADAVDYFRDTGDRPDVVLLDGCDHQGLAPSLCTAAFITGIHDRLRLHGVLAVNLVGSAEAVRDVLSIAAMVFEGRIIVQNVGEGGTRVAYAFRDPAFLPAWDTLQREARILEQRHGLDFPALARKLQRSGYAATGRARSTAVR